MTPSSPETRRPGSRWWPSVRQVRATGWPDRTVGSSPTAARGSSVRSPVISTGRSSPCPPDLTGISPPLRMEAPSPSAGPPTSAPSPGARSAAHRSPPAPPTTASPPSNAPPGIGSTCAKRVGTGTWTDSSTAADSDSATPTGTSSTPSGTPPTPPTPPLINRSGWPSPLPPATGAIRMRPRIRTVARGVLLTRTRSDTDVTRNRRHPAGFIRSSAAAICRCTRLTACSGRIITLNSMIRPSSLHRMMSTPFT